jgi:hypothetical protein
MEPQIDTDKPGFSKDLSEFICVYLWFHFFKFILHDFLKAKGI